MAEPQPIPTSTPAESKPAGSKSRRTYLLVFAALAVITAAEIGVTRLPVPQAPVLVPLALFKAALVAMFYMHLKYDRRVFGLVFLAGLLMGIGLILALLALFSPAGQGGG
jgi:cytochrome c oxidase subunit IV